MNAYLHALSIICLGISNYQTHETHTSCICPWRQNSHTSCICPWKYNFSRPFHHAFHRHLLQPRIVQSSLSTVRQVVHSLMLCSLLLTLCWVFLLGHVLWHVCCCCKYIYSPMPTIFLSPFRLLYPWMKSLPHHRLAHLTWIMPPHLLPAVSRCLKKIHLRRCHVALLSNLFLRSKTKPKTKVHHLCCIRSLLCLHQTQHKILLCIRLVRARLSNHVLAHSRWWHSWYLLIVVLYFIVVVILTIGLSPFWRQQLALVDVFKLFVLDAIEQPRIVPFWQVIIFALTVTAALAHFIVAAFILLDNIIFVFLGLSDFLKQVLNALVLNALQNQALPFHQTLTIFTANGPLAIGQTPAILPHKWLLLPNQFPRLLFFGPQHISLHHQLHILMQSFSHFFSHLSPLPIRIRHIPQNLIVKIKPITRLDRIS